jgi:hypothetical protein
VRISNLMSLHIFLIIRYIASQNITICFEPYRGSRPSEYHSCFVFGRSQVQMSALRPLFCLGFLVDSLQPNSGLVLPIKPRPLPTTFFPIHYLLIILLLEAVQSELLAESLIEPEITKRNYIELLYGQCLAIGNLNGRHVGFVYVRKLKYKGNTLVSKFYKILMDWFGAWYITNLSVFMKLGCMLWNAMDESLPAWR